MERHELNRMFDGLNPDPKRERELLDQLLQDGVRRKTPMRNWKRAVLAAAAAVMLLGTAAAAHYMGVKIIDDREKEDGAVWFAGGITYYPADQLSDEVRELAQERTKGTLKAFDSWEAMEEFVGAELMDNPVLDGFPWKNFRLMIDMGNEKATGRFLLRFDPGLTELTAFGCYEIGEISIIVEEHLFTDRKLEAAGEWDERFLGIVPDDELELDWESCTTPGGKQVQVIETVRDGRRAVCRGAFSLNGNPVVVRVHSDESVEQAHEILFQVLDGFA